jgi:hypothetical protein
MADSGFIHCIVPLCYEFLDLIPKGKRGFMISPSVYASCFKFLNSSNGFEKLGTYVMTGKKLILAFIS